MCALSRAGGSPKISAGGESWVGSGGNLLSLLRAFLPLCLGRAGIRLSQLSSAHGSEVDADVVLEEKSVSTVSSPE